MVNRSLSRNATTHFCIQIFTSKQPFSFVKTQSKDRCDQEPSLIVLEKGRKSIPQQSQIQYKKLDFRTATQRSPPDLIENRRTDMLADYNRNGPPASSNNSQNGKNNKKPHFGEEWRAKSGVMDENSHPGGANSIRRALHAVRMSAGERALSHTRKKFAPRNRPVDVKELRVMHWKNELKRFQYLREKDKLDSAVASQVYEKLLEIDKYKEHSYITPEVLTTSKLGRLVKVFRHSPYDKQTKGVADRICKCWRNLCRDE